MATALAQSTAVAFASSTNSLYIAAFGTDRVANVDTDGNIFSIIGVGPAAGATVDSRGKRGPRGLALNALGERIGVLNRISDTISVINTSTNAVTAEIPVGYDPTPLAIKAGRGSFTTRSFPGTGQDPARPAIRMRAWTGSRGISASASCGPPNNELNAGLKAEKSARSPRQ